MKYSTKSFPAIMFFFLLFYHNQIHSQWEQQQFPGTDQLYKIDFTDSLHGWVAGFNSIYRTTDGGETWTTSDIPQGKWGELYALDAMTVFYSTWNSTQEKTRGIRRTINGGNTWETVDTSQYYYNEFEFVTDQIGFAACGIPPNWDAVLCKTTDGGESWTTIAHNFENTEYELTGISFIDESLGWTVTYDGYVFRTVDGGFTWSFQDSIRAEESSWFLPVRDIEFTTPDSGWAVGGISGVMLIAKTVDGGQTWSHIIQGGSTLRQVSFLNSKLGWFCGSYNSPPYIARTIDGGLSWNAQEIIPFNTAGIESISMINESLGWAVGINEPSRIYKTITGGVVALEDESNQLSNLVEDFKLFQNYPNPFNPRTTIAYNLPIDSHVNLVVYNLLGQPIKTLVNKKLPQGSYEIEWNGRNDSGEEVGNGVYIYQLKVDRQIESRKMVLLK